MNSPTEENTTLREGQCVRCKKDKGYCTFRYVAWISKNYNGFIDYRCSNCSYSTPEIAEKTEKKLYNTLIITPFEEAPPKSWNRVRIWEAQENGSFLLTNLKQIEESKHYVETNNYDIDFLNSLRNNYFKSINSSYLWLSEKQREKYIEILKRFAKNRHDCNKKIRVELEKVIFDETYRMNKLKEIGKKQFPEFNLQRLKKIYDKLCKNHNVILSGHDLHIKNQIFKLYEFI
jgi:hypothetical protein